MKKIEKTLYILHSMVLSGEKIDGIVTKLYRQSFKELNNVTQVLKLAKEALLDLGACDDPNCDSPNCNKAIKRINELLGELENELKIKSKISRCYTRMAQ